MNVDSTTIAEAIQSYAVMLNRPQWLDESRLLLQETVWARLVRSQPGRAVITLTHFETAIQQLTREERAIDITVPQIVQLAARLASDQDREVARLYASWEAGEQLLLGITSRAVTLGPDGLDELRRSAARCAQLIAESALDGHDVEQMLDAIESERIDAERRIAEAADVPELDAPDADQVISDWLHQPPYAT